MNIYSIHWKLLLSVIILMLLSSATLTYVLFHFPSAFVLNAIMTTLGFLVLSILVIFLITRSISKPIVELTDAVRTLSTGNFSAFIPLPRYGEQDEVSLLVTTFAQMAKKLKRLHKENTEQNVLLEQTVATQRTELEQALKHVTENIKYMTLIQSSLLPNMQQLNTYLPKHFLIWQQHDVVGGDMLYIDSFEDGVLVALVDTNHIGIASAYINMIVTTNLKKITREESCHTPGDILQRLNVILKTVLQLDAQSKDALSVSICWINPTDKTLLFAGAQLSLYYISNQQLNIIQGEQLGLNYKTATTECKFLTHLLKIEEDFSFYISSHGFLKQVGGAKALPFGQEQFKELLLETSSEKFEAQSDFLLNALNEYKGDSNNKTDITVMGFKLAYNTISPQMQQKKARAFLIKPKEIPQES